MNTTMADGAEQRLDAQIAEALFGQPGMNKMDVANRVRELRGDGPALLVGGSHGSEVQVADGPWPEIDAILADAYSAGAEGLQFGGIARRAAVRAAVAALSAQPQYITDAYELGMRDGQALAAQPSPGGQGDALPPVREDQPLRGDEPIGEQHDARMFNRGWNACREAAAAPAARQPVGQITDTEIDARLNALYREMVDSGQHNGGMSGVAWDRAVYRMASSKPSGNSGELDVDGSLQPVGQEPLAWLVHWSDMPLESPEVTRSASRISEVSALTNPPRIVPLYAAPPAQAVDLGQFRPPVEFFIAYTFPGTPSHAEGKRLLALIDSKAVGNGQ
ncbi:TPA: hypothetical protein UOA92_000819 [Stenotrophomonas maltophilia]|nr:hypothetical protein [Stenotrophomonas maltophilia]